MRRTSLLLLVLFHSLLTWAQIDVQALDQYFQQAQKDWNVPGLSIAVVKNGKVILAKGYGVLEKGKTALADENSLYAIASNTKAFISASIGILVDEGKLKWDDPVQKYLPYFELYDPYVSKHATVRDLLCHRLGLGTFSGDAIWYKTNYSAEEVVKRAHFLPQNYEFRAGYGYTNLMFIAAGEVIRAASGQPWDVFVKERIFKPLGMDRSQTSTSALSSMSNVAMPHKSIYGPVEPIPYAGWDNMGAAGGIISSVSDMARWMNLQLNQGSHNGLAIFSTQAQETFWTMHNSFKVTAGQKQRYPTRHFAGYGLGWNIADHGGRMIVSHGGGYDGMYSHVMMVPEEKLGVVVLTNSMTGISPNLCFYVVDQYLGQPRKDWSKLGISGELQYQAERRNIVEMRKAARVKNTTPALSASALVGKYTDPLYGTIEVKMIGDKLEMHFPHGPQLDAVLGHWHYDTYEIQWKQTHAWYDFGTVQFLTDNNRKVTGIQFDVPNEDIFFEEIHAKKQ
ncbi:MAG TPA: serine hydrolase [Haliscomenobacter sp.]|uniref:serine hydrolase n=1 Tax=Haliscomenobacter sp. TaxID=2717303 RepID=UPI002C606492|nr:serine hydrolase [Haliscomenobacter sp.]HOY21191.1 serine hydrolase [Haliscomenobacter sp.]